MTLTLPYANRRMYEPDGSIAELVRRSGQAQAEGIRRGGDISANMWGNLGQIGSRAVSDYAQQRAQQAEQKRMDDAAAAKARAEAPMREEQFKSLQLGNRKTEMDIAGAEAEAQAEAQRAAKMAEIFARDTEPSAKELIVTLGDKRGIAAWEALRTMKDGSEKQFKDQNELLKKGLQGLAALPEEVRAPAYAAMRQNYLRRNLIGEDMAPPEYNPEWFAQALNFGEAPKAPGTRVLTERRADGTEVERIVPDVAGQTVMRAPSPKEPKGPASLTPNAESALINKLAGQWTTATKPAVEISRQVKLMDAGLDAARKGDLVQGAQAVLVTFQKILDPPSVVRESEYNRSAAGLALKDRVMGAFEKLMQGGAGVPLGELEKFANLAREAARAQSTGYLDSQKNRIGQVADRYGIPKALVFEDFDFAGSMGPKALPSPPAAAGAPSDPLGIRR